MRPQTLTGIHVPNRLKLRSSQHPANEHGLVILRHDVLETSGILHMRHQSLNKNRTYKKLSEKCMYSAYRQSYLEGYKR